MRPKSYVVRLPDGLRRFTPSQFRDWVRDLKCKYPGRPSIQQLWLDVLMDQVGNRTLPDLNMQISVR